MTVAPHQGRKLCSGPGCRSTVGGRHRFCRFHWRLLPIDTRKALGEAFASKAWHVFQQLGIDAAAWLRRQHAERIAAANAATARILGERAD